MPEESVSPGAQALRALSHPVRMRMLGLLRIEGPSTASRLAEQLGLNTGATSYHLRQLAQHGFIEEEADRGDQRDRWWRAAHRATYVDEAPAGQEAKDAADAFAQAVVMVHHDSLQRAVEQRSSLPDEWRHASTLSDFTLRLTSGEAEQLIQQVVDLLGERSRNSPGRDDAPEGARDVIFQLHAFPYPGFTTNQTESDDA